MAMQRTPPTAGELPRKGHLLPDLWLADASGNARPISSYRDARTAIVIAAGSLANEFIRDLATLASDFGAENIAVIVIVPHATPPSSPHLIVLADPDGSAHARFAGSPRQAKAAWAAYVTDQYAEIYAVFREAAGDPRPSAKDLLDWAKFVNIRCEECFPPEWPDTP
jgi:hypothetical protein